MKRGSLRLSLFFVVLLVLSATACGGSSVPQRQTANYVPNPSFERNLDFWIPSGKATLSQSTTIHRVGSASVQVTFTGKKPAPDYGLVLPSVIGYPAQGSRFKLSFWAQGAPGRSILAELIENGGVFPAAVTAKRTTGLTGNWQQMSLTGAVRRNGRGSLDILIIRLSSVGRGESFYVDGVRLIPVGARNKK